MSQLRPGVRAETGAAPAPDPTGGQASPEQLSPGGASPSSSRSAPPRGSGSGNGNGNGNGSSSPHETPENYRQLVHRYAEYAPIYDRRFANYSRRTLAATIAEIPLEGVENVLDVACGTGLLGEYLRTSRPGLPMLGVDISPDMLEVARARFRDEPYDWKVGRAESLPTEDDSFDVITCNSAFHLVESPLDALAEFRRVLRPGGRLVIVDWCREYPTMHAMHIGLRIFGKHPRNMKTLAEQTALVEQSGLDLRKAERFKVTWFWGLMVHVAFEPER